MNKKKLLALLMALVMTISLLPAAAIAEELTVEPVPAEEPAAKANEPEVTELLPMQAVSMETVSYEAMNEGESAEPVAQVGSTEYATIEEAVAAWTSGTTLTLLADVQLATPITVTEKVTLNLSSYTLSAPSGNNHAIIVAGSGNANLTIDADKEKPGHIKSNSTSATQFGGCTSACIYANYADCAAKKTITINGGVFDGALLFNQKTSGEKGTPLAVTINGGTFNADINAYRCYYLTINGGTFNNFNGRYAYQTTTCKSYYYGGRYKSTLSTSSGSSRAYYYGGVDIQSATKTNFYYIDSEGYYVLTKGASYLPANYEALGDNYRYLSANVAVSKANNIILQPDFVATQDKTVSSGKLTIDATANGAAYTGNVTFTGSSGTFILKFRENDEYYGAVTASKSGYHVSVSETKADGVITRTYRVEGDGAITEENAEAKIGSVYYGSVYDAFYAVDGNTENKTITLLKDVNNASIITNGRAVNDDGRTVVTFDLNGHKFGLQSCGTGNQADYTLTVIDSGEGGEVTNDTWSLIKLALTGDNDYSGKYTVKIQGGTWHLDPENVSYGGQTYDLVPDGFVVTNNGNGTWTVGEKQATPIAQIGDDENAPTYDTVQAAIAAINTTEQENAEITITGDTEFAGVELKNGDTIAVENTSATIENSEATAKEVTITQNSGSEEPVTTKAYVVSNGDKTGVITSVSFAEQSAIANEEDTTVPELVKVADVLAGAVAEKSEIDPSTITSMELSLEKDEPTKEQLTNITVPEGAVAIEVHPIATITTTVNEVSTSVTYEVKNSELAQDAEFVFSLDLGTEFANKLVKLTHYPTTGGSEVLGTFTADGNGVVSGVSLSNFSPVVAEDAAVAEVLDDNGGHVAYYDDLAEAMAAVGANGTVKLLKDVSLTDRLFINAGSNPAYEGAGNRYATTSDNKSITLDLNDKNITSSSNIALAGGSLNITGNGTIETTGSGLAPVEIRGTGDLDSKRTLTIGSSVILDGSTTGYGLNVFGSNDAQKNIIDVNVNGTVKGTLFVLGNLKNTANDINIVVNGTVNGGTDEVGIALNGFANVTVNANANVSGKSGIEVRAGNLTVNGGTITGTGAYQDPIHNGSGTTSSGAAVAVAQHSTKLPISVTLTGGTLSATGENGKAVVVADPEGNGNIASSDSTKSVQVVATSDFVQSQTVIPEGYEWKGTTTSGTFELVEKELTFRGGSLRRRVITGTTTVVNYETDLRFCFMLPAGAEVDTSESYFRWNLNAEASSTVGRRINITNVDDTSARPLVNMVITKIPAAYYNADIYCFIHIKYTIGNETKTLDLTQEGEKVFKRSVVEVCDGLIAANDQTSVWPGYAQNLKNAAIITD